MERPTAPQSAEVDGIPLVPILAGLLETAPPERKARWQRALETSSRDGFFRWANSAADADPLGSKAIPRMTNLAVFVYKQRPDLQAAFPDIFGLNRLGYAAWFLRYAGHRYELDRSFLTPIALSWISKPSLVTRIRRVLSSIALAFLPTEKVCVCVT
jgi:hypothetical protein